MVSISIVALLSACASTPDVVYSYYPAKLDAIVTVTQTIACDSKKTSLVVSNDVALSKVASADLSIQPPYSFSIRKIDGFFADSDAQFDFFDDGRLKGINVTTTGQGEAIAKAAIGLATALVPLAALGSPPPPAPPDCATIDKLGGGKPVSLIYAGSVDSKTILDQAPFYSSIDPKPGSAALHARLKHQLQPLTVQFSAPSIIEGARYMSPPPGSSDDSVRLKLQETDTVKVSVRYGQKNIWSDNIVIPGKMPYELPVPKAALFGTQKLILTLSDVGAITSIHYGKTTGAAGLLNVGAAAATAAAPETTTAKVAEVKAQADLIAQQQRLLRCQTEPAKCE